MGRRLRREEVMAIEVLAERDCSKRAIARQVVVSRSSPGRASPWARKCARSPPAQNIRPLEPSSTARTC
jgi:hypothetical protein